MYVPDSYAEHALELGIQLRYRFPGSTATALCVGDSASDEVLRRAYALTANAAVRAWDPSWLDLDALATRGISVEEVRLAVTALSSVAPIGSLRTGQQFYILEIKGAEPFAAYFKSAVVAWRNGAPVRLQDIAKVEDSVEDDEARTEFNGVRSIIVSVQRQPDAKTKLAAAFKAANLPEKQEVYAGCSHGWCVKDMPMGPDGKPLYNEAGAERAWSELTALYKRAVV